MKKLLYSTMLLAAILSFNKGMAQWQTFGNNGFPGDFLGTNNNFPLNIHTNDTTRMIVNGTKSLSMVGGTVNTSGHVGIGNFSGTSLSSTGPLSLLHLEGPNGGFGIASWRSWMKTGMFIKEQQDAVFLGLRPKASYGSDAILSWMDDPLFPNGTDIFKFVFLADAGVFGNNTNPIDGRSHNGYEFMQMAASDYETNSASYPTGFIGVGPVFTQTDLPQSRIHLNAEENLNNWMQFTNANGTGQQVSDGLRVGILGDPINDRNGNALIYQQEERHLLFSTNASTASSSALNTNERMRVTSVSAPTLLANGAYGTHNPSSLSSNVSRVSVSYDPTLAVTRPLSLMHLGYNVGSASGLNPNSYYGWREWMDIGAFTSNGKQNVYVGLKQQNSASADAIVNWGGDYGKDNLRFIFSDNSGAGNPSSGGNGLEMARFIPSQASTLPGNSGMLAIGDFSAGANLGTTDAKVDIDGDLRIREVRNDNSLTRILAIDPTDRNRVRWIDANNLVGGNTTANNGLSILGANTVQLGQANTNGVALSGGELLNDREIPMNGFNMSFYGIGTTGVDRFSIGKSSTLNNSKFNVFSDSEEWNSEFYTNNNVPTNIDFQGGIYSYIRNVTSNEVVAVKGELAERTTQPALDKEHIGVLGKVVANQFTKFVMGVKGYCEKGGMGGYFESNSLSLLNASLGLRTKASGSSSANTGIYSQAIGNSVLGGNLGIVTDVSGNNSPSNIGVKIKVDGTNSFNYGIYAQVIGVGSVNYAGYFVGDVYRSGSDNFSSDIMLKQNVDTISNSIGIISQLLPKTYQFDTTTYSYMRLPTKQQYGFVAQDVETILPELVKVETHPATYDTLGVEISPSLEFKSLNYNAFIAILTDGIQKQQNIIEIQDSTINNLETRLTALEDCLDNTGICNGNGNGNGNGAKRVITPSIELSNLNAIVLDQNLPNPFAEKTTINYSLPEEVVEAQIMFYNMDGKIIKQVTIDERGDGSLTVYGENLKNGIYTYSLIADGKLIATKRMVKTN